MQDQNNPGTFVGYCLPFYPVGLEWPAKWPSNPMENRTNICNDRTAYDYPYDDTLTEGEEELYWSATKDAEERSLGSRKSKSVGRGWTEKSDPSVSLTSSAYSTTRSRNSTRRQQSSTSSRERQSGQNGGIRADSSR